MPKTFNTEAIKKLRNRHRFKIKRRQPQLTPETTPTFRQSMMVLHTWISLLFGWIMFIVFLFGTVAFFRQDITNWMKPEIKPAQVSMQSLNAAGQWLASNAPDAKVWRFALPDTRGGALEVHWSNKLKKKSRNGTKFFDPVSGEAKDVRDTMGGNFLYRFHFMFHHMPFRVAATIVCLASVAMLVSLITGVIMHRKLFSEFFLLRLRKNIRSWIDSHIVLGLIALPFHIMITYSGLVALMFVMMPWAVTANFNTVGQYKRQVYQKTSAPALSHIPQPVLPISDFYNASQEHWQNARPRFIKIINPGDYTGIVEVYAEGTRIGSDRGRLTFLAATGDLIKTMPAKDISALTRTAFVDLHTANFSSLEVRWLYFVSGLIGTGMIASGMFLWTNKRRKKQSKLNTPDTGFRIVEWLNIGMFCGPILGISAYFLANRLLPINLADRADLEVRLFFGAWFIALLWSAIRKTHQAWIDLLFLAAFSYGLIPVVNAITTSIGLLPSLKNGDWSYAIFDTSMLIVSAGLTTAAYFTHQKYRQAHTSVNDAKRRRVS